jgi:phage FluMu gp28-like protein
LPKHRRDTVFSPVAEGRRFGKTILGENSLAEMALTGVPVAYFAPTYKMLTDVWAEMRRMLQPVTASKSEQLHRIELITGGVIDMWSLDTADVARGRKYKRVVIDEAAMVRGLAEAWQAVIRPTLTDYEGDAWFLSTPKGRNFFWELWLRGQDPGQPEYKSWQMPTSANPYIKASEIAAAQRELPERVFSQEYLAEFLEDGGGVFRRVVEAATAETQDKTRGATQYVFGVDWGKHEDFTVITVLDVRQRAIVYLDRFSQIDYSVQTNRLRALYERFRPSMIIAERNSMGEPLIEQLQRAGLPMRAFLTTNASKAEAIDALALAFERGDIRIPNNPVLIGELQAYQMERLPSGLLRYAAPEGMHDDCVIATALAWHGMASTGQRARVREY